MVPASGSAPYAYGPKVASAYVENPWRNAEITCIRVKHLRGASQEREHVPLVLLILMFSSSFRAIGGCLQSNRLCPHLSGRRVNI
jgi:hypothetical protein